MSDRLVTVATFHEPVAAAMAKNYLQSNGISAVLVDETTIATDWMLSTAIGGIKLQVFALDMELAEHLLDQIQAAKDEEGPLPQTAIATREIAEEMASEREDKEPINVLTDRLFRSAVLGLLFCPLLLYTMYLLMEIAGSEGTVSPNRRWKIWATFPLLIVPVFVMSYFVSPTMCLLGGL